MSDIHKYYYLKIKDSFFNDERIQILEEFDNGIYYSNLLLKLYLKSLKSNGSLKVTNTIPYNEKMIAKITNLNIDIVRSGLKVLIEFGFIERLSDGTLYMLEIQNYIGTSSTEADRKRNYRSEIEKQKQKLLSGTEENFIEDKCPTNVQEVEDKCPTNVGQTSDKFLPEIEKEIEKEIEIEKDREEKNVNGQMSQSENESSSGEKKAAAAAAALSEKIITFFNKHCTNFKSISKLDDDTINILNDWYFETKSFDNIKKCFEMAQKSTFLKGKPWATFHWIISDKNRNKVIDGNYMNGDISVEDKKKKFLEDYKRQKEAGLL